MAAPRESLLERLALHRPELRAWALYDWANSAFWAIMIASVFPIFFEQVAAAGDETAVQRYTFATTASLLIVALLSPALGAIADYAGTKKRFLAGFIALGVVPTGALFLVGRGDWVWASVLFGAANIGVAGSAMFADALLPTIARGRELDRVATSGFALGYLSGGLLLALAGWMTASPQTFGLPAGEGLSSAEASLPARLMFAITAAWWALFSLPVLLRVPEPPRRLQQGETAGENAIRAGLRRLAGTFGELRRYRQAFLLLIAFLIYNDGVLTIIRMASIYGAELKFETADLIRAILLVQFVAVPCSAAFGWLAGRIGTKPAILVSLGLYLVVCVYAFFLTSITEYYLLAALVGVAQGGAQALSRSLFASMIPVDQSGEFFGLFGVLEKFAGVLGPAAFGLAHAWSGSSRPAMLVLIVFFVVGGLLLLRVDVEEGRRAVRAG